MTVEQAMKEIKKFVDAEIDGCEQKRLYTTPAIHPAETSGRLGSAQVILKIMEKNNVHS